MKRCCLAIVWIASALGPLTAQADGPVELNVMSFNVLVDFSVPQGVPKWNDRRDLCVQVIEQANPDLIGFQETSPKQVKFFAERLPGYAGHHFREGKKEFPDALLMYKTSVFEPLETGHWWLSPTPEKASTGFGNALPRLVVWARLKHRATGRELVFFNTHFDNSMPSQVKMAALCQQKLEPFVASGLPLVFVGDFNTSPSRGDYPTLVSNGWRDAYLAAPQASADGNDEHVVTMENQKRIDHILYRHELLSAIAWERLESPDPQRRLSDHWPIQARLRWQ